MKKENLTMDDVWEEAIKKCLPFFVPKKVKKALLNAVLSILPCA